MYVVNSIRQNMQENTKAKIAMEVAPMIREK